MRLLTFRILESEVDCGSDHQPIRITQNSLLMEKPVTKIGACTQLGALDSEECLKPMKKPGMHAIPRNVKTLIAAEQDPQCNQWFPTSRVPTYCAEYELA